MSSLSTRTRVEEHSLRRLRVLSASACQESTVVGLAFTSSAEPFGGRIGRGMWCERGQWESSLGRILAYRSTQIYARYRTAQCDPPFLCTSQHTPQYSSLAGGAQWHERSDAQHARGGRVGVFRQSTAITRRCGTLPISCKHSHHPPAPSS